MTEENQNLRIWDALGKTDPAHTKTFRRAGGFSGTAMKPIWIVKRMTEQFGPCGIGWGMGQPQFDVQTCMNSSLDRPDCNNEILVFCHVSIWYQEREMGKSKEVWGVGGDKVVVQRKSGPFYDDEAYKKAYTDAVNNALKWIGVGADVHMGQFDDNKYVQETAAEFRQENAPEQPKAMSREAYRVLSETMHLEFGESKRNERTKKMLRDWATENSKAIQSLPEDWLQNFREEYRELESKLPNSL